MGVALSIITPSFNQAAFIEQTICSVRDQSVPVEHIVIDGGSTDGTVDILRRYEHLIWTSEPDAGQADALNKGLALASGNIVGWINSDDYYAPNALAEVVRYLSDTETQWVIGNLGILYDATGDIAIEASPAISASALLENPDIVRQQAAFFRRDLLKRAGGWDSRFYMAMDYELWFRLLRIAPPLMVDQLWAYFRIHAGQKTSALNVTRQFKELTEVMKREGASTGQLRSLRLRREVAYAKTVLKDLLIKAGLLSQKYESRPVRIRKTSG